jgi:hypothetical protein
MMKPAYRALDVSDFAKAGLTFSSEIGTVPEMKLLPVEKLVIDPTYQREVGTHGKKNVRKIVNEFRFSRFEPIVVAPTGDGRFAIINGQHRAMAAKLRGVKMIPSAIVKADQAEQAAAFAAINGNVTAISSMQLFHANLAAGDSEAKGLAHVCKQAKVNICRYPVPANLMKPGDTLAAGALSQSYRQYGPNVLMLALRCITETGKGNVGLVRAQLVKALCIAIKAQPKALANPGKTIKAVEIVNLKELWVEGGKLSVSERRSLIDLLSQAILLQFQHTFGKAA